MTPRLATWIIVAVAAVLRFTHVLTLGDYPLFDVLPLDSESYNRWAGRLLEGEWVRGRPFYQAPLYAYVLAGLHALSGGDLLVPRLLNAALGTATVALAGRLGRISFGPWIGVLAAAICAIHATFLFEEGKIMKTSLGVFLAAASLTALVEARASGRDRGEWAFLAGLLGGLASLVRENFLLFLAVAVGWTLWREGRGRAVALAAGIVLPLIPVVWHNSLYDGEFLPVTSQAGQNFYTGVHAGNPYGGYLVPDFVRRTPRYEESDFRTEAERRAGRRLTAGEVSRYWFSEGLGEIGRSPLRFVLVSARKVGLLFHDFEIPDDEDIRFARRWAPVLRMPLLGFGPIAVLGIVGLWVAARRRRGPPLVALFVVVYSLSVILFFVFSRYRLPLVVPLSVFAAFALHEAWLAARAHRFRSLAIGAAVTLVLGAIVYRPLNVAEGMENSHLSVGIALEVKGRTDAALVEYRRGLTLAPGHPKLLRRAAGLAFAQDVARAPRLRDETLRLLRDAVGANPGNAELHSNLGIGLAAAGDAVGAVEQFRTILDLGREPPGIHFNLALAYEALGDVASAREAASRALERGPDDAAVVALRKRLDGN